MSPRQLGFFLFLSYDVLLKSLPTVYHAGRPPLWVSLMKMPPSGPMWSSRSKTQATHVVVNVPVAT